MSDDRGQKLARLICENFHEVEEIRPASNEYYFKFRGRVFSVLRDVAAGLTFFAYPKWLGNTVGLIDSLEDGIEDENTGFAALFSESGGILLDLYKLLKEKYIGIDDLFEEFGID